MTDQQREAIEEMQQRAGALLAEMQDLEETISTALEGPMFELTMLLSKCEMLKEGWDDE